MASWKKTLLGLCVVSLAVILAGYATAWISLASCADQSFAEIEKHGTAGMGMDGHKVVLTHHDVRASVSGPFLVDVQYVVPHDLHGTLHISTYLALPWGTSLRSSSKYPLM